MTWEDALGRPLVWVDVEGVRAYRVARARLDAIRERQRQAEADKKPRG